MCYRIPLPQTGVVAPPSRRTWDKPLVRVCPEAGLAITPAAPPHPTFSPIGANPTLSTVTTGRYNSSWPQKLLCSRGMRAAMGTRFVLMQARTATAAPQWA